MLTEIKPRPSRLYEAKYRTYFTDKALQAFDFSGLCGSLWWFFVPEWDKNETEKTQKNCAKNLKLYRIGV